MKAQVLEILSIGLMMGLFACSSQKVNENAASEEPPAQTADTDVVPSEGTPEQSVTPEAEQANETSSEPPPETAAKTEQEQPATVPPPAETSETAQTATPSTAAAEPIGETPEGEAITSYTLAQGDTLMKIAFETYGDLFQWKKIYELNKEQINDPNTIPVGTVLKLEKPETAIVIERNGEKYLIKMGDTLGKISDDIYGVQTKWKKLWKNNKQLIRDPNKIFAGFYLYYTITPEEKQEAERLKQQKNLTPAPAPIVQQPDGLQRSPAVAGEPQTPVLSPQ